MTPNEEKDVSWSSPKRHRPVPLDQSGGEMGPKSVFGDQDPWWELGKGEVNTLRTSHLGSFISTRWLTIVKKRGVVHKFSMHFCKPTEWLWLFGVKQNLQPYITPICTMRNSKKRKHVSSILTWLHLPQCLGINFKRSWNSGRWRMTKFFHDLPVEHQ